MANYIVTNCINSGETQVVFTTKGQLSPGQVVYLNSESIIGCYTVIEETVQDTTIQINGQFQSCVECFSTLNFVFEIKNCKSENSSYFLPIDYNFSINGVYGVNTGKGIDCFQFLNITQNQTSESPIPTPTSEYETCNKCLFDAAIESRNNNPNYQQMFIDAKNNYSSTINNRGNQQPAAS
jgi:hypothetical protein